MDLAIIGEAPSSLSDPQNPLYLPNKRWSETGRSLSAIAGCSLDELVRCALVFNLCSRYPGTDVTGIGSGFSEVEASSNKEFAWNKVKGKRVVFLGRRVAQAMGIPEPWCNNWGKWYFYYSGDTKLEIPYPPIDPKASIIDQLRLPDNWDSIKASRRIIHTDSVCTEFGVIPHPSPINSIYKNGMCPKYIIDFVRNEFLNNNFKIDHSVEKRAVIFLICMNMYIGSEKPVFKGILE